MGSELIPVWSARRCTEITPPGDIPPKITPYSDRVSANVQILSRGQSPGEYLQMDLLDSTLVINPAILSARPVRGYLRSQ